MTEGPPLTAVVGRTERALGALLLDALAGSGVDGNDEWVTLSIATTGPGADLVTSVAEVLRSRPAAQAAVESLRRKGILDGDRLTGPGAVTASRLRTAVSARTTALAQGLDPADAAAAVRVLDILRTRALALADQGSGAG